ncbi:cupin domain-containing protein [Magnetospirillum sulfuroxidans]|uniref:JmjC domain-containing protein n=1 Tax=Magnetospirillum sulfuroxidans TaxID=611300 RepID=A0ABS5IBH5_9PROT|nr:cupin domain-containing protein [Magnetospirillum sulfuroxidans]MBR9971058.1 hypothetical protein [Magnetospirillum sulfuroxidans]
MDSIADSKFGLGLGRQEKTLSFQDLIAPLGLDQFMATYYEKKELRIQRNDPQFFSTLLTLDDIDHHLTHVGHNYPSVNVANALDSVPKEAFTFSDGRIDKTRLYELYSQGCTIVMRHMHRTVPALARLCRSAEQVFSCEFQTNVYFTPPGAQGFKIHYDTHDIFALQVLGKKRWRIYGTPRELPLARQDFNPTKDSPGDLSAEFDHNAGDVYYFPRGLVHDAVTSAEPSIHITLGMLSQTWTELMLESLLAVCHENVEFRHNLPIGALAEAPDLAAMETTFRQLVSRFADKARFEDILERFRDAFITSRQPLNWGRSRDHLLLPELNADTVVGPRPELVCHLRETADQIVLHVHTAEIAFPAAVAAALTYSLGTPSFTVRDMPGLADDASRLVLARRLVREGILTIA